MNPKKDLYRVIYQMIALSFLVFILFGGVLFFYLLPKIETVLLSQKKIMLKSMVQVAVGFIENQYQAASKGNISIEAIREILDKVLK